LQQAHDDLPLDLKAAVADEMHERDAG
jgi:hypothetical protein